MDKLEKSWPGSLAPAATGGCIPEGVKRVTTWAPLPDPLLYPRGHELGLRLEPAEALRLHERAGLSTVLLNSRWPGVLVLAGAVLASTAVFSVIHWLLLLHPAIRLSLAPYSVRSGAPGRRGSDQPGPGGEAMT